MSLDAIKERLKHIQEDPIHGVQHEIIWVINALSEILQKHEALLLYAYKTLDLEYHRRADELYEEMQDGFSKESLAGLTHEEKLERIEQVRNDIMEAREKLKEEFNICP